MARASDSTNTKDSSAQAAIEAAARLAAEIAAKIAAEIAAAIAAQKAAEKAAALAAKKAEEKAVATNAEPKQKEIGLSKQVQASSIEAKAEIKTEAKTETKLEPMPDSNQKLPSGNDAQQQVKDKTKPEPKVLDFSPQIYPGTDKKTDEKNTDEKKTDKATPATQAETTSAKAVSGENRTVSSELTQATAKQLEDKINPSRWAIDPRRPSGTDIDSALASVPRTKEAMGALEKNYKDKTGHELTKDLENNLSLEDAARLNAVIKNPQDDSKKLTNALDKLDRLGQDSRPDNKDLTGVRKELTQQLQGMSKADIEKVNQDLKNSGSGDLTDLISKNRGLSTDYHKAAEHLLKGADGRTTEDKINIAKQGVTMRDSALVAAGLGGDSNAAARKEFQKDPENMKALNARFSGDSNEDKSTRDTANFGGTTIGRHVEFNQSMFGNNKEVVSSAIDNMTESQRQQLNAGRTINEASVTPANASDSDLQGTTIQRQFQENINKSFGKAEGAGLSASAYYGKDNVISKLAATHSDGVAGTTLFGGHKASDIYRNLDENISQSDAANLKSNPNFRKDLNKLLQDILPSDELKTANEILDRKAQGGDYTKSVRNVSEKMQDLDGQSGKGTAISLINIMSESERNQYGSDANYRSNVDAEVKRVFGSGTDGGTIANKLLTDIKDGKEPKLTAFDNLKVGGMNNENLPKTIQNIEELTKDPAVRAQIANPVTELDKQLSNTVKGELNSAISRSGEVTRDEDGRSNSSKIFNGVFNQLTDASAGKDGKVDLSTRLDFTRRDSDARTTLANLSKQEKDELLTGNPQTDKAKDNQRAVFGRFSSPEEKQLVQQILREGESSSTIIRGAAISKQTLDEQEKKVVKDTISQIKDPLEFSNNYAKQYNQNPTEILNKIPREEQAEVKKMLEVGSRPQSELVAQHNSSEQQLRKSILGGYDSGTQAVAKGSLQNLVEAGQSSSDKTKVLTTEEQKKLSVNVETAQALHEKDQKNTANTVADVTVTAASMAATGGGASVLRLAALGAVTQVGTKATLLGSNYDLTKSAVPDALVGATNAGINKFGLGNGGAATTEVSELTAKQLLKKSATEYGQSIGTATIAGGASGFVKGVTEIDPAKTADHNLANISAEARNAAIISGATGAVLHPLIKAGENVFKKHGSGGEAFENGEHGSAQRSGNDGIENTVAGNERAGASNGDRRVKAPELTPPAHPEIVASSNAEANVNLKNGRYVQAPGNVEQWQVKGFTTDTGAVIAERVEKSAQVEKSLPIKLSAAELEKYPKVSVNDKVYHRDADGNLYENQSKSGDASLVQNKDLHVFQKSTLDLTKPKITESTNQYGAAAVTYEADGRSIKLEKSTSQPWLYSENFPLHNPPSGWQKVHVDVSGNADLSKVNRVLLTELANPESKLSKLSAGFKTFDPRHAEGLDGAIGMAPTGKNQGSKGFTFYANNAEHSYKLQSEIDSLLKKGGLDLPNKIESNNAGVFSPLTNRVYVTRDVFQASDFQFDRSLFPRDVMSSSVVQSSKVDQEVAEGLLKKFNLTPGQQLSKEQLGTVTKESGLLPNTLAYDKQGDLVRAEFNYGKDLYMGGRYSTESESTFGSLTDRRAAYKLADYAEQDLGQIALNRNLGKNNPNAVDLKPEIKSQPANVGGDLPTAPPLVASLGGERLTPAVGKEIPLGRNHQQGETNALVSREHAYLGRDALGNLTIRDNNSANGVWIKHAGQPHHVRLAKGEKYTIQDGDNVRLGGATGPMVDVGY